MVVCHKHLDLLTLLIHIFHPFNLVAHCFHHQVQAVGLPVERVVHLGGPQEDRLHVHHRRPGNAAAWVF